jgi:hypothetical protein
MLVLAVPNAVTWSAARSRQANISIDPVGVCRIHVEHRRFPIIRTGTGGAMAPVNGTELPTSALQRFRRELGDEQTLGRRDGEDRW